MVRSLQEEIKQTKPFVSLEDEVYLNLRRTADALLRRETEVLKTWNLTPTQYNALRILRGAGEGGVTCGEMSERLLTRDPDITRLIDRLETRGLISRRRSEQDRRVVLTHITEAGLSLLAEIDGPSQQWTRDELRHLDSSQLRQLITLLELARAHSET